MKPIRHAIIAARRYGGCYADFLPVHVFMDSSKGVYAGQGHRIVLHSEWGVEVAPLVLGKTVTTAGGRALDVRQLAIDHCIEDVGCVPTVAQWLAHVPELDWECRPKRIGRLADWRDDAVQAAAAYHGGDPMHYRAIVDFMDRPMHLAEGDRRGRLLSHNAFGIWLAAQAFGEVIEVPGVHVPVSVRDVCETLVLARYGWIPSLQDAFAAMRRDDFTGGRQSGKALRERKKSDQMNPPEAIIGCSPATSC